MKLEKLVVEIKQNIYECEKVIANNEIKEKQLSIMIFEKIQKSIIEDGIIVKDTINEVIKDLKCLEEMYWNDGGNIVQIDELQQIICDYD